MGERRGKRMIAAAAVLLCLAAASSLAAQTANKHLFYIERSKNTNIVRYDAVIGPDGKIDPKRPVVAYWELLAHDGSRHDLNFIERAKAYGFDVEPEPGGGAWRMTLAAYKREIKIFQEGDEVRAQMVVDGRPAYLEKIYITSKEGFILPTVISMEIFGKDAATGEPRYEKISP